MSDSPDASLPVKAIDPSRWKKGADFAPDEYRPDKPRKLLLVIPVLSKSQLVRGPDKEMDHGGPHLIHPLGVAYVAGAARELGHEVTVLSLENGRNFEAELEEAVRRLAPDAAGITCYAENFEACLRVAELIKSIRPGTMVIGGGPQATAIPDSYLDHPCFDAVILGEAEITICRLLQQLGRPERLGEIEGLYYKDKAGKVVRNALRPQVTNLDTIPRPALDLYPLERWFPPWFKIGGRRAVPIVSARGCPFECTYCSTSVIWGRTYRYHSAERVVDEMNDLHRKYGFGTFIFYDDILTISRKHVIEMCEAIIAKREADFAWCANSRVDCVDPELLRIMKKAGCCFIGYGIESNVQRLLDRIKKGVTVEQNKKAVLWTREAEISVGVMMMIGLPTETRKETKQTIRFILDTKPDFLSLSIAAPFFGTEMMPDALANGYFPGDMSLQDVTGSSAVWVPNGRTRQELERWREVALKLCRKWSSLNWEPHR
jgi:radical SAM superfamily enzyme YgiQ (UPF0313 family)